MNEKKYLGQIMKERGYELGQNTMIVAPVGSGKTYYILNDLIQGKEVLYLCDNGNLRDSVKGCVSEDYLNGLEHTVTTMCYASFGKIIRYDTKNEFISKFDLIVCDEIHNLLDYQKMKNSVNLEVARVKLFDRYDNTQIVFFTATPYYVTKLKEQNKYVLDNFEIIEFDEKDEIKQYYNKRKDYVNHISQIQFQLDQYEEFFKCMNGKCLIYTSNISDMKFLEDMVKSRNLRPICIWSTNADEKMDEKQLKVRQYLLETGELLDPYNVLIINRATETGVNIYDEYMGLVIVNTTNITQQIQARGRVRHDVDLLVVRTNENEKVKLPLQIDEKLLDVELLKTDIEDRIIHAYGLKDEWNRFYSVKRLGTMLEKHGYAMESYRKTSDGKKRTVYKITKLDK